MYMVVNKHFKFYKYLIYKLIEEFSLYSNLNQINKYVITYVMGYIMFLKYGFDRLFCYHKL